MNRVELTGTIVGNKYLVKDFGGSQLYTFILKFRSSEAEGNFQYIEVNVSSACAGFLNIKDGKFVRIVGSLRNRINNKALSNMPRVVTLVYANTITSCDEVFWVNEVKISGEVNTNGAFYKAFADSSRRFCRRTIFVPALKGKRAMISLIGWGSLAEDLRNLNQQESSNCEIIGRLSGHSYRYKVDGSRAIGVCHSIEVLVDSYSLIDSVV